MVQIDTTHPHRNWILLAFIALMVIGFALWMAFDKSKGQTTRDLSQSQSDNPQTVEDSINTVAR